MTQIKIYGENAFTFLLFNEINGDEGKLTNLLKNLKQFDKPKSRFLDAKTLDLKNEPEIWLFPSFGKRSGFGEPDALLLVDEHVFWFEVETKFDLGPHSDKSKAIDSLRQLYRFHCAALAFAKGQTKKDKAIVIEGRTITNRNEVKEARLALRGHGAASQLRRRLKTVCKDGKSHYILLSVHKPSGGSDFHSALREMESREFAKWDRKLSWPAPDKRCLQLDHCWYTYWSGDLNRFFKKDDFLAGYVPIKKGS